MMRINLNEYLAMGGCLEKLDLKKTFYLFHYHTERLEISSILKNEDEEFLISYKNGTIDTCSGIHIQTDVDIMLDPKYKLSL